MTTKQSKSHIPGREKLHFLQSPVILKALIWCTIEEIHGAINDEGFSRRWVAFPISDIEVLTIRKSSQPTRPDLWKIMPGR
jgi:hypothetical protein